MSTKPNRTPRFKLNNNKSDKNKSTTTKPAPAPAPIEPTPTTKRGRQLSSSPESTPPPKIPTITSMTTENQPLTLEAIRALLTEQTSLITTSLRSEMKTLGDEIKSEFQMKISQINEKIDANQENVQQQINSLKSNVAQCMEQATGTDDDMQRLLKLNELKINGIAYNNNENLCQIFTEIANLVQFNLNNVNNMPMLTRIFKYDTKTKSSSPTPIIIVKFVAKHIRNDFYRLYLNKIAAKQPIMTENIGLPKGSRIIVGENLTTKNFEIFVEAGKKKKEGKLCQVFTQDGLVHVKAVKNAKAKSVRSVRELELFIHANPPMKMQTVNDTSGNNNNSNSNASIPPTPSMNGIEIAQQQQQQQQSITPTPVSGPELAMALLQQQQQQQQLEYQQKQQQHQVQ